MPAKQLCEEAPEETSIPSEGASKPSGSAQEARPRLPLLKTREAPLPAPLRAPPSPQNAPANRLIDSYGRQLKSLRISLTDRCNLRCTYCLPEGSRGFAPTPLQLSFDHIVRLVSVASRLGVDRIRLTGGEPLLRPKVPELVARLKQETQVRDLALTSNGILLASHAQDLAEAGLDRVTVSLDSLDPARFEEITRWGKLDEVWEGIRRAAAVGLGPIKINVVVLKGMNDDEIDRWVELSREQNLILRFLELMPIGAGAAHNIASRFVNLSEVRKRLQRELGLVPISGPAGNGPARYWQIPGAKGCVGFITPLSESYCDTCSRLRITATGELRPCLAYDDGVPMREVLDSGDESAIEATLRHAVAIKPRGHAWRDGQITRIRMSGIGG